jgi:arylsulfatase A-like enzyme
MRRTPKQPNVLVFIADALRADRLHCCGNERETSPAIDALAREGVLFRQMIAQSANTMPCVVSALTGLDPLVHGLTDPRTHGCHSWAGWKTPFDLLEEARYEVAGQDDWIYFHLGRHRLIADEAQSLSCIGEERNRPFFLWRIPEHTHLPYNPPPPYDTLFLPARTPISAAARQRREVIRTRMIVHRPGLLSKFEQEQAGGRAGDTWSAGIERDEALSHRSAAALALEPEDRPWLAALYDGEVRALDDEIGRCVELLRQRGLLDDTVIVVTGDHGEELLERGSVGHTSCSLAGTLHEEAIRVPFIVRYPRSLPRGRLIDAQVSQCDIMPTLFDLIGLSMPAGVQGRSLLPLAQGHTDQGRAEAFAATLPCGWQVRDEDERVIWCVRTPHWKLIRHDRAPGQLERFELFDLAADPGETTDLFAERPKVAAPLEKKLREWMRTGTVGPG